MSNVHIHLHVSNLEASRASYERFLGAEPVKVKARYVNYVAFFAEAQVGSPPRSRLSPARRIRWPGHEQAARRGRPGLL